MIPIELTIEGFYSYRAPQTITFDELTSNQLFGIFGEVGSGKSAILEAITFVIYDSSNRLNARENRSYNMMNLQSDRTYIDFTCWAGSNMRTRYRFIFEAKRNSKQFSKIGKNSRRVMVEEQGKWVPIEKPDTKAIIGMEYKHFCQTTIIPQGKFREFIELGPKDRTDMMQELFQLNRFDLGSANQQLLNETEEQLQHLSGKLALLEPYSEEALKALAAQEKATTQALTASQKTLAKAEEEWQQIQQLQAWQEEASRLRQQQERLQIQAASMKKRANQLLQYQKAYTHFYQRLQVLDRQRRQLQQTRLEYAQASQAQQTAIEQLEACQAAFAKAQANSAEKTALTQKAHDLSHVIDLKKVIEKRKLTSNKLQIAQSHYEQVLSATQALQQQLTTQQANIDEQRQQLPNVTELHAADRWLHSQTQLAKQLAQAQNRQQAEKAQAAQLLASLQQLMQPHTATWETAQPLLDNALDQANASVENARQALIPLKAQEEMVQFAHNLNTGDPCPLCGATEHPAPIHHFDKAALDKATHHLAQAIANLRAWQSRQNEFANLQAKQELYLQNAEAASGQIDQIQQEIATHQKAKPAGNWEATAVRKALEAFERQSQAIVAQEAQLQALRTQLTQHTAKKEQANSQLQVLLQQQAAEQERNSILRAQITLNEPTLSKWLAVQEESLKESLARGEQQIADLDNALQTAEQALQAQRQRAATGQGSLQALQKQEAQQTLELANLEQQTTADLTKFGFASEAEVANLLEKRLDMEQEQLVIRQFEEAQAKVQQELTGVAAQLQGRHADEATATAARQAHATAQAAVAQQQQQLGQLGGELERHRAQLAAKQDYLQTQAQLTERQHYLSTIKKMFLGKGFVEFVARTYLRNLVKAANERFFRLTHQSLSLELQENEKQPDFVVRDYLNEGRVRLLKTLSGGQLFQASLCLALALAEHIQQINKADKSFFFLDEGFGTLDKSALRVVFDTLQSLRQENRIVGVISHVEALQQEIEVALLIENTEEAGSRIRKSWLPH